ncbi:hypothetical protein TNCV_4098291 [Trichonephila clavipes]|nr:hypothetical protein TNCV_4098291 [Trichonephila clavipes]
MGMCWWWKVEVEIMCYGSGDDRRVAIMDFGAPLTIGKAYLKIIMSSFLGFCEWNTRKRWHDGQVCPDVDKELWRLGPDSSGVRRGDREKKIRGNEKKKRKELGKREGLIVGRGEENPRVLLGDADQESKTRMRKTPCGLDRDKLWSERFQNGDSIPAIGTETINFTI